MDVHNLRLQPSSSICHFINKLLFGTKTHSCFEGIFGFVTTVWLNIRQSWVFRSRYFRALSSKTTNIHSFDPIHIYIYIYIAHTGLAGLLSFCSYGIHCPQVTNNLFNDCILCDSNILN